MKKFECNTNLFNQERKNHEVTIGMTINSTLKYIVGLRLCKFGGYSL